MLRIVVIGAGSVGANVAYRLAQRGACVTVLEAEAPGSGTSGASFAWVNAFSKTPRHYHDLNAASMDEHVALVQELGEGAWFRRDGALHWEESPEEQTALRDTAERLEAWGYPVQAISPCAARELEPDLAIDPSVEEVIFAPTEGYVEMAPLIAALLAAARRHGARILPGHRVSGVIRERDRVVGVTTEHGASFRADVVVNCAGPALDDVVRLVGIEIPFDRVPGLLVYTNPVATTLKRVVYAPGLHFRPDGAGRIVLGQEDRAKTVGTGAGSWTPEQVLERAVRHLPVLAGARVEASRVGIRPMPSDKKPMVGPLPGLDGFYLVASHSAVTLGPLWGRIAATELLDGTLDPRLEPFRPARFL